MAKNRLFDQNDALVQRYRFDGVFLDISAGWMNDPHYDMFQGTRPLIERLRAAHPDLLIAGEGWYDAMSVVLPLHQSGHTDGVMHAYDRPFVPFFETANRQFGHPRLGNPGRGSRGVHERSHNPCWREPVRRGVIPTITRVENTLEHAPERVLEIIDDAKYYAANYL